MKGVEMPEGKDDPFGRIADALEELRSTLSVRLGEIDATLNGVAVSLDRIDDGIGALLRAMPAEPERETTWGEDGDS